MDSEKIFEAIDALGKDRAVRIAGKTKKVTATLPVDVIELVNRYKEALGYPTFSSALRHILEDFFNGLVSKQTDS